MKASCRVMSRAYTQRRLRANLDKWHMHVQTEALAVKSGSEAQTHTHKQTQTEALAVKCVDENAHMHWWKSKPLTCTSACKALS
jgi:hypothetical protein